MCVDGSFEQPRPVRSDDREAIARLAARAFPSTQAPFVRADGEGFVVEACEGLAAAVLLRVIVLPGGCRVGFVSWAMTNPEHRGSGYAGRLAALGIERLKALGCTQIVTEIEGHNAASERVFEGLGFRRLSLHDQIAAFGGLGALWVRVRSGYVTDPGHFLWLHGAAPTSSVDWQERLLAVGLNGSFALVALAVGGGLVLAGEPRLPGAAEIGLVLVAVALLLGMREGAMRAAAGACGLRVVFRAWDSGLSITTAIALLFGRLFPLPGSVYPCEGRGRQGTTQRALGIAALAGAAMVAFVVAAAMWTRANFADTLIDTLAASLLFVGKPLLLFDTVMAFPPFQAFAARRIFELHRGLWAAVATLGLALFLL